MDSPTWRVVVVRAWPHHDGEVAAVLLVAEQDDGLPVRRITTGSVEATCAALATVLRELTAEQTGSMTAD